MQPRSTLHPLVAAVLFVMTGAAFGQPMPPGVRDYGAPGFGPSDRNAWGLYADTRGTRVEYPRDLFSVHGGRGQAQGNTSGQVFTSRDGRARLHVFAMPNPQALSPEAFMRANFAARGSALTYQRVAPTFFALSTRRGSDIVYVRCNFSGVQGGMLHCIDLVYPARDKTAFDPIVTRISRSLRPLF